MDPLGALLFDDRARKLARCLTMTLYARSFSRNCRGPIRSPVQA
jgi:hypothetical protein